MGTIQWLLGWISGINDNSPSGLPVSVNKHSAFTWALVMQSSSGNCSPAPDLVLREPVFQRVFFSGGVFLFTDTSITSPWPHALVRWLARAFVEPTHRDRSCANVWGSSRGGLRFLRSISRDPICRRVSLQFGPLHTDCARIVCVALYYTITITIIIPITRL